MPKIFAYTTITIQDPETGTDVTIDIEAVESTLPPGGKTLVNVYVTPVSFLDRVGVDATEGSLRYMQTVTKAIEDEDVEMTRNSEDEYAKGSLNREPINTPTYTVLADIGGSSNVTFSGKDCVCDSLSTDAQVIRCDYSHRYREYEYTAASNPVSTKAILQAFLTTTAS